MWTFLLVTSALARISGSVPCYECTDFDYYGHSKTPKGNEYETDELSVHHVVPRQSKEDDFALREIYSEEDPRSVAEEADVVDRQDHFTQHLSDLMVNTDNEITSLQAGEMERINSYGKEDLAFIEDRYFAYLTGQEPALEIDNTWSFPARNKKRGMALTKEEKKKIEGIEKKKWLEKIRNSSILKSVENARKKIRSRISVKD